MPNQSIIDALMGTWPARLGMGMLQGAMAPGRAYQSTPANPVTTEQMVEPAANLAGLAMTGAMPFGVRNAVGMGIKAYHGSPYDFDKFELSKIGTGEGAQSYGHGLYYAENPAVARDYRTRLAPGTPDNIPPDAQAIAKYQKDWDELVKQRQIAAGAEGRGDTSAIDAQMDAVHKQMMNDTMSRNPNLFGRMYEVNINAKPEQFLDWDKPLNQQSPQVRAGLEKTFQTLGWNPKGINTTLDELAGGGFGGSGGGVYNLVNAWSKQSEPAAAAALREAGIPGIRYLDQGSRNMAMLKVEPHEFLNGQQGFKVNGPQGDMFFDTAPEAQAYVNKFNAQPTSNYVVFNPDIVDILKKYGLAGAMPFGIGAMPFGTGNEQQQ